MPAPSGGGVAELADAHDLGSCGLSPWEFESPRRHQYDSPDTIRWSFSGGIWLLSGKSELSPFCDAYPCWLTTYQF